MRTNKYIAFEGVDGSGKTKQSERLFKRLQSLGLKAVISREPGSPHINLNVRDFLLSHKKIGGRALELLFQADRAEHTEWIEGMLKDGFWVVSDRSYVSGLAYAESWGHSLQSLLRINEFSIVVKPDLIFYMDVSVETSMSRTKAKGSNTREEARGSEVLNNIRNNFLTFASSNVLAPQKFCSIDSEKWSEDESAEYINRVLGLGVTEIGL